MAGMKFEYDENGGKFFYFLLSFYAMIIIPCTYYFWPKREKNKDKTHAEDLSSFGPCREKYKLLHAGEPRRRKKEIILKIVFIIAWAIFFVLAYKVTTIETEHKEYDPYSILNVDRGATDKEIRKQYRELSKTMHPDKGGDPEKFKDLTKAYKALTDEETRKNWEEYGNPDGPGATHFGIALPKWMVDDKNSIFVLGFYVLIFMIFMPIIVGVWWYNSIKYTTDKLFMRTFNLYFIFLRKSTVITIKRALMILGASAEFNPLENPEILGRPSDNVDLPWLIKELPNLQEKNREVPLCYPFSVKARALIHAHLSRIEMQSPTLVQDKQKVIRKCPFLISEMVNIVAQLVGFAHGSGLPPPKLEMVESVMKLSPMIVQALWENEYSLLQLPYIESGHMRHFVTKKRRITTIKQFAATKDSDRRSILRYLTDEQYDDIMRVCNTFPEIEMKIKLQVEDDEDSDTITAGALVTVVVQLKRNKLKVSVDKDGLDDDNSTGGDAAAIGGGGGDENGETNTEDNKTDDQSVAKPAKTPWKQPKKPKYAAKKPAKKPVVANKTSGKQLVVAKKDESGGKVEEIANSVAIVKENNNSSDEGNEDDEKNNELDNDNDAENSEDEQVKEHPKEVSGGGGSSGGEGGGSGEDGDDFFEKFQKQQKKREKLETKVKKSHRVYCPYFPEEKQECWWLYVADRKNQSLISAPVYICTLEDTEELEIKFSAPRKVGNYTYTVCLKSDSYLEFDTSENIKLDVKEAKKIEEHPQWKFEDEAENEGVHEHEDDEYATESDNDE